MIGRSAQGGCYLDYSIPPYQVRIIPGMIRTSYVCCKCTYVYLYIIYTYPGILIVYQYISYYVYHTWYVLYFTYSCCKLPGTWYVHIYTRYDTHYDRTTMHQHVYHPNVQRSRLFQYGTQPCTPITQQLQKLQKRRLRKPYTHPILVSKTNGQNRQSKIVLRKILTQPLIEGTSNKTRALLLTLDVSLETVGLYCLNN